MKRKMAIALGALLLSASSAIGENLPENIKAYLGVKGLIPQMDLEGLSICKLLERNLESFYALPTDKGQENCDLSNVILAYGGWCTAGVEDSKGVHFSKTFLPQVRVVKYEEGYVVVYLNNYLKANTIPTQEDLDAATRFFQNLSPEQPLDIRGEDKPIFPKEYEGQLPPKAKDKQ